MQSYLRKQQICFFHVPKTAGASVIELLRTSCGQANVFHVTDPRSLTRPIAQLFQKYPIVAGHFFARYLSSEILSETFVFTFLRAPLERVLSQYSYYRGLPGNVSVTDPGAELAKKVELKEIFAKYSRKGTFSSWSNLQTAIFSGCNLNHPVDDDVLEQAKHNLEQFDFVGIHEELDNGIRELFLRLGLESAPQIPMLNKTIDRLQAGSLDHETTNLIAEYNHHDRALFLHAEKLWKEKHLAPPQPRIITDLGGQREYGTREVEITSISIKDGEPSLRKVVQGRPWSLRIKGQSRLACTNFTVGVLITDESGTNIYGTNSYLKGHSWTISPNSAFETVMQFAVMNLATGHYNVTVSFHTGRDTAETCFHWLDKAFEFEVVKEGSQDFVGVADLGAKFEFIPDPR